MAPRASLGVTTAISSIALTKNDNENMERNGEKGREHINISLLPTASQHLDHNTN